MIAPPSCLPVCYDVDDPLFLQMLGSRALGSNFAQWSFPPSGIALSGKAPAPVFSRDGNATRGIGVGQIETVAPNVLRMDYDTVTGEYLGALFEGQKPNLMPNTLFSTGLGVALVSTTVDAPDGTLTARRYTGLQANTGDRVNSANCPVAGNTSYNASLWVRGIAGQTISLLGKRGGNTTYSSTADRRVTFTGEWQPINIGAWTTAADNLLANVAIANVLSATADTIDVWQPQIELGGLSSTILTPSGSATRQADTMIVNDMSFFDPSGGIILVKIRAYPGSGIQAGKVFVSVGSGMNVMRLETSSAGFPRGLMSNGSTTAVSAGTGAAIFSETEWEYFALVYSSSGPGFFGRRTGSGVPIVSSPMLTHSGAPPASMFVGSNINAHFAEYGIKIIPGQYTASDVSNLLAAIP